MYVVANPVRALLDKKKIRGTSTVVQSSNESMKTKQNKTKTRQKRQKEMNNNTKHMPEKRIGEGHSIERVWYSASREPSPRIATMHPNA